MASADASDRASDAVDFLQSLGCVEKNDSEGTQRIERR